MNLSSYLCRVVGEDPSFVARWHASTVNRTKAFALAIHIPVLLWGASGYVIGTRIFALSTEMATTLAISCAALIYLIERLVLATPRVWYVSVSRVALGVVVALIGASGVDLVVFNREISQQLREAGEQQLTVTIESRLTDAKVDAASKRIAWMEAQARAECEANGTCGTKHRSIGPVYRELKQHAEELRLHYLTALANLEALRSDFAKKVDWWRHAPEAVAEAGLLARIESLHQYTINRPAALTAWALFFLLVLGCELMVVLAKSVFAKTVDDEIAEIREAVSRHNATAYRDAITSPVFVAQQLLQEVAGR